MEAIEDPLHTDWLGSPAEVFEIWIKCLGSITILPEIVDSPQPFPLFSVVIIYG